MISQNAQQHPATQTVSNPYQGASAPVAQEQVTVFQPAPGFIYPQQQFQAITAPRPPATGPAFMYPAQQQFQALPATRQQPSLVQPAPMMSIAPLQQAP